MFRLGFRAFFLLAGILASLLVPLWLAALLFGVTLPTRLYGPTWHGHEMVFGFACPVIAGFLLTAARNWTNVPTATGPRLAALAAVFVAGRLAILFGAHLPNLAVAVIDLAFLPILIVELAIPIVRSRNWRNLAFVPLLLGLFAADAVFHFAPLRASLMLRVAIDVIVVIIVVIGGRVIPMFTANALKLEVRRTAWVDRTALASVVAVVLAELLDARICAVLGIVAGALNGIRLLGWRPLATRHTPILWVLHAGYAWLAIGLVLKASRSTTAMHALALGAIGTLILGMMSRVSLGHTGRALTVSSAIAFAYVAVIAAASVRSIGLLVAPTLYRDALLLSGAAWTIAFATFTIVYAPILVAARVDGKPG